VKTIPLWPATTVDADGVALAAIQGLNQKLESELIAKEARLKTLEQELAALRRLVAKLEGLANQSPCEDP
jgi:flagellar motility protein MotE (MotC chaperone)